MTWDQHEFLRRLAASVDRFDHDASVALCDELIGHVNRGVALAGGVGRKVMGHLRRKAYFDQMERVAEVLHVTGQDDTQVRRQYAQALIDQGKTAAAMYVLEALIAGTTTDPEENAEARGLLGRVYKQLYVNALAANLAGATLEVNRGNLRRSIETYHHVYADDPATHLWHGINAVALTRRAERDGQPIAGAPDAARIASDILQVIGERMRTATPVPGRPPAAALDAWDLATAAEASLALGDTPRALGFIAEYVQKDDADAFEVGSTLRQLQEVWGLTIETPPGSLLLPLLQTRLLSRRGGRVDLERGELGPTLRKATEAEAKVDASPTLEKIFGKDGPVSIGWYRLGLQRARIVAKILDGAQDGFGTGFLIRGGDLHEKLGDEILLLTNAHVVSNDPQVQATRGSLDPDVATVSFEALEGAAGRYRVTEVLWTSPPDELDATLLRLDPPPPACDPLPVAKQLPVADGVQKVYVIGHPGGRTLSISLNDNLLLDWDDRLIHYRAPTEGGSSGSPVFNQQWGLIGLHHAGGPCVQKLKGEEGTYAANEAICIQRIVSALAS